MSKVLVACEESQMITIAMRNRGIEAYSCDIQECSGGHPEWHIQDDVLKHLNDGWNLMIAHPPCTHLATSGARYFKRKQADGSQQLALDFVNILLNANITRIALENPVSIISTRIRKPDQIIQPYQFGDCAYKTTCLWLKNLPKLISTKIVEPEFTIYKNTGKRVSKHHYDTFYLPKNQRSIVRSKTFPGIAEAIADQWGSLI